MHDEHTPSLVNPLAKVRGLGSAKSGTHHWWLQRVTAVLLVPFSVWLMASLIGLSGAEYSVVRAWIGHPLHSVLLVFLFATLFIHAALGCQVILEDYVSCEASRLVAVTLVKIACIGLFLASTLAILRICITL